MAQLFHQGTSLFTSVVRTMQTMCLEGVVDGKATLVVVEMVVVLVVEMVLVM